ncbi:helix-turn-helix transcriptional regulator [Streptomyces sp. Go-475]|uniref:helix-turn-helix transcriptional regulator n=1 Tax=Streptomyces sp. Go-475 TaxID=2072505 RepID=UPI000DEFE087|nr:helix-turn-helix transcriptional regulator [Streptomyces sp. Go-475]AXE87429.1 transcriptional regulator NarL [Streptomyces sp. Go-475]
MLSPLSAPRLRTAEELQAAAREVVGESTGEVFCYWNYTSVEEPLPAAVHRSGLHLRERAGEVRTVLPRTVLLTPEIADFVDWHRACGFQVGTSAGLPPGAMLLTDAGALVTTAFEEGCDYAWIRDGRVLEAFRALARMLWGRADAVADAGDESLGATDRKVLLMLTQGATDRVIARELDLSDRTVRRIVASLLERLGARSRFEAGMLAAARGWV